MQASCTQFGAADNSASEISDIQSAIQSVGSSSGVDPRFILAIVMQESNGCVRAPTTNYGVINPGLMQSHDGSGSCNDGSVLDPCPQSQITQMIEDGTEGTSSGVGLKQLLAQTGATDVSQYYKAARMYNSGSIAAGGNLGAGVATHCYASDVANRLLGWATGPSSCNANTIETLTGSQPIPGGNSAASVVASVPVVSSTPVVAASSTTAAGGVFAQTGEPSVVPVPTTTAAPVVPSATAVATSAPAVTVSTVAVIPTAASSASPVAPVATSAAPSPPASTGTSSSSGGYPAGSACTTEGEWNCVTTSSFQQCASGTWSVVQQLAAGTECTVGQGSSININAIASKRTISGLSRAHSHLLKHARHAVS